MQENSRWKWLYPLLIRIFAPLISRCKTPCSWRYLRPRRTCVMNMAVGASENGPKVLTMWANDPSSISLYVKEIKMLRNEKYSNLPLKKILTLEQCTNTLLSWSSRCSSRCWGGSAFASIRFQTTKAEVIIIFIRRNKIQYQPQYSQETPCQFSWEGSVSKRHADRYWYLEPCIRSQNHPCRFHSQFAVDKFIR